MQQVVQGFTITTRCRGLYRSQQVVAGPIDGLQPSVPSTDSCRSPVGYQAAIQVPACEWVLMSWAIDDVPGPALMTMSLAQQGREAASRAAREGRNGDIPGPALPSIIRLHSP